MARASDGTDVPVSPLPASSSNMGSPNGSLPDLEGPGFRASTMEEKINEIYLQLPLFMHNAARIEKCVQTVAQTVAAQTTKTTNIEQIVGSLVARVTSLEQNAASGSSSPDSARSWNAYLDIVTAPQPLGPSGPMAQGRLMTVEIRGVGLIRSPVPKMNQHEVPFYWGSRVNSTTLELRTGSIIFWETSNIPAHKKPVRIHCKAGSVSARLVFETRAKCQDFFVRYKDDGIPYAINSPFCCAKTTFTVRQSKLLEDRKIGKQFAPLWRVLADQLKLLFPGGGDEGAFTVPAHDARSQILSIKDRRNGIGKPVFKLASLGSGQTFTLVTPELSVSGGSPDVLQRVLSQANKVNV